MNTQDLFESKPVKQPHKLPYVANGIEVVDGEGKMFCNTRSVAAAMLVADLLNQRFPKK